MPEPIVTPEAPIVTPVLETPVEVKAEVKPAEDLFKRVSSFKPEVKADNPFGLIKEDYDKVNTDPVLSKFYKSMLSDYTKKTQNLAEKSKEFEKIKTEYSNWTPERIQQELNNPRFVESAKIVAERQAPSTWKGSQEQWSNLTDSEKVEFQGMKQEINALKMQSYQTNKLREDETLRNKYANYNPESIDIITDDLLKGKVQATREHLYKAYFHDDNVRSAYELGKQDALKENKEKTESVSYDGLSATPTKEVLTAEKNESSQNYFRRLAGENLKRILNKK